MINDDRIEFFDEYDNDNGSEQINNDIQNPQELILKNHIKIIRNADFDLDVKIWVENEICNITERFHKYDMISISSYFIKACAIYKKPYKIDEILRKLGTTKDKKKIITLTQGTNVKKSLTNTSSVFLPYMNTSAVAFINEIIITLAKSQNIELHEIDDIITNIIHFTRMFCDCFEIFQNFYPRSCACAFIYFYFKHILGKKKSCKLSVTQDKIKKLKFGDNKEQKLTHVPDFEKTNKLIIKIYNEFLGVIKSQEELEMLTIYKPI